MIRVIEHGYRYEMESRCPSCGCHFAYHWEDVLSKNSPYVQYGHTSDTYVSYPEWYIRCPDCGCEIKVLNWTFPPKDYPHITWTCKYEDLGEGKNGITFTSNPHE